MSPQQLIFTKPIDACDERPITFAMMVHSDVLKKFRKDSTVPLVDVFDSFQIFKFEKPGKEGKLVKPSAAEMKEAFSTTNDVAIGEFMVKNGSLHGAPHTEHQAASGNDLGGLKSAGLKSNMAQH